MVKPRRITRADIESARLKVEEARKARLLVCLRDFQAGLPSILPFRDPGAVAYFNRRKQ